MKRFLSLLLVPILLTVSCVGRPWHRGAGDYVVVQPAPGQGLAQVAEAFGGGGEALPAIVALNPSELTPKNSPLLVPVTPAYELGIRADGYQVVPVLTYRWGKKAGAEPLAGRVRADLLLLESLGCTLLAPSDFLGFVRMERSVPERSVLLAFEVHSAEGFRALSDEETPKLPPGLLFLDPSEVGTQGHLSWEEVESLAGAGLEPALIPSASEGLAAPAEKESLVAYTRRVKEGITSSRALLARHTTGPVRFAAYPGNGGNSVMASVMVSLGIQGIFRWGAKGNPFFCDTLGLVRMDAGARGADVSLDRYLDTFRKADVSW